MKIQRRWTILLNKFKYFTFVSDKFILIILSETVKSYPQLDLPLAQDNNKLF